ncbi:MAG: RNA-binding S4 domain-containing protein [Oscillospiraceae bacterium]
MSEEISINSEFIKLDSFLKFAGAVGSGGEAKTLIAEEQVSVNSEICTQRGRKLRPGDTVSLNGDSFTLVGGEK